MGIDLLNSPYCLLFGSFWIFWTFYFIFNVILFLKNRNSFYIRSRAPWLIFCSGIGQYLMITSLTFKILLTPPNFPNIVDHWFIWLMIPLHLLPYPVRSLRFIIFYNVSKIQQKIGINQQKENEQELTCVQKFWEWFRNHPKFLTDRAFFIFNWCLMAIPIIFGIVRNIIEESNHPGHYGAPNSTLFFAWCTCLLVVVSIFLWLAYYYIRKVNDGLYYNFEIKAIGIIWVIFIGLYIILGWTRVKPSEIQSIMGIILCVLSFLVSFGFPVQLAVVKPPDVSFNNGLDNLEAIMEPKNEDFKRGKKLFKDFLTKRACLEGFLFYDYVRKFQVEPDQAKRTSMFKLIKQNFIEDDAISHINIQGAILKEILKIPEATIGNEALNEAFEKNKYLLQTDQFPPFKNSPEARKLAGEIKRKNEAIVGGDHLTNASSK